MPYQTGLVGWFTSRRERRRQAVCLATNIEKAKHQGSCTTLLTDGATIWYSSERPNGPVPTTPDVKAPYTYRRKWAPYTRMCNLTTGHTGYHRTISGRFGGQYFWEGE